MLTENKRTCHRRKSPSYWSQNHSNKRIRGLLEHLPLCTHTCANPLHASSQFLIRPSSRTMVHGRSHYTPKTRQMDGKVLRRRNRKVNANLLKSLIANHRNALHRTPRNMLTPEPSTTPLIPQKARTPNLIQARIVRGQGGRPTTHRFTPTPQLRSMYETWLNRQIHPRRPTPILTITSFKLNTDSPPTWYARAPDSPTLRTLSTIEVVHSLPHPQQSSSQQSADTPDSQHRSDANPL